MQSPIIHSSRISSSYCCSTFFSSAQSLGSRGCKTRAPRQQAMHEPSIGPDSDAGIHNKQMQQSSQQQHDGAAARLVLPVMPLPRVKLPTELLPLQAFEPRYRQMFKQVNAGPQRLFGVALTASHSGTVADVGTLCELTHFVPQPEQRRIFVMARAIGRFRILQRQAAAPFLMVEAVRLQDAQPASSSAALQAAAAEGRVWRTMQELRGMALKVFGHMGELGDDVFSVEVRRWCPDPSILQHKELPSADPALLEALTRMGINLHHPANMPAHTSSTIKAGQTSGAREYLLPDYDLVSQCTEQQRRERFSFAVVRSLEELASPSQLQRLLECTDTLTRLQTAEACLLEGGSWLAARAAVKELF